MMLLSEFTSIHSMGVFQVSPWMPVDRIVVR
jgi:hypothetical protein